jgi:hypothetical protein
MWDKRRWEELGAVNHIAKQWETAADGPKLAIGQAGMILRKHGFF